MSAQRRSEQDARTAGMVFDAFPYPPYPIQQQLMAALYTVLSEGGVGLFESPTGTGKTLSLICGALKWLEDTNAREEEEKKSMFQRDTIAPGESSTETSEQEALPAWMTDNLQPFVSQPNSVKQLGLKDRDRQRSDVRHLGVQPAAKKARQDGPQEGSSEGEDIDESFLLPEWNSDGEEHARERKRRLSGGRQTLESDPEEDLPEEAIHKPRQVYFSSRTHSQLSQFVGELKKTRYRDSMSLAAMASRQTLCINKDVQRLGASSRINEKCLDLQQAKSKASGKGKKPSRGCPYLQKQDSGRRELKDAILETPMDVEELSRLGSRRASCPYYASRSALPAADLVLLPYAGLLSHDARESLGIKLAGSIVIVDEAHNLVAAVHDTHSALLSSQQIQTARSQLAAYYCRFQSRLATGNDQNIQMLLHITEKLTAYLQSVTGGGSGPQQVTASTEQTTGDCPSSGVSSVNHFLFATGIDTINLFRLIRYVKESRLLVKVAAFGDAMAVKVAADQLLLQPKRGQQNPGSLAPSTERTDRGAGSLQALVSFLESLNNLDADGRIITDKSAGTFKFVLLNAAAQFSKILESAHAVVLASGTLAPISSLQHQLFPGKKVHTFSCGHVIPKTRLLALALANSPSGAPLDLRHRQRSQSATLDQLGRMLINICQAVPQGVVVFLPSIGYAEEVHKAWRVSGLLPQLAAKKQIFTEPREGSQVEVVLKEYGACIAAKPGLKAEGEEQQRGAVLLCVVGGKMSEGINFGDGLGRCVVMMGMPYPNPSDPELLERMKSLDTKDRAAGGLQTGGPSSGRVFYEDLCMKAVNQCIGRVIRHKGDWAAIILADARWTATGSSNPRQKLPVWIQDSLQVATGFGDAYSKLTKFCKFMSQQD